MYFSWAYFDPENDRFYFIGTEKEMFTKNSAPKVKTAKSALY